MISSDNGTKNNNRMEISSKKKYFCTYENCGYTTFNSGHLKRHIITKHKRDPADLRKCEESGCEYATFYPEHLKEHIIAKHKRDPADLITCTEPYCEFCTFYSGNLRHHIRKNAHWYNQEQTIQWEILCKQIAHILLFGKNWQWKPQILTPEFPERFFIVPEIVIYENEQVDVIIDAKISPYALTYKDYNIYPQKSTRTIFWILEGKSHTQHYNSKILEFVSADDLIQALLSSPIYSQNQLLITDIIAQIQNLKLTRTVKSVKTLDEQNRNRLDSFLY